MRFMLQLWSDEAAPPSPALVSALARYNDELEQAGILLAVEGLVGSRAGVHITRRGGEPCVHEGGQRDGPKLGAGFWIVRTRSKNEAVDWARRCPLGEGDVLEVRQLFGEADISLV